MIGVSPKQVKQTAADKLVPAGLAFRVTQTPGRLRKAALTEVDHLIVIAATRPPPSLWRELPGLRSLQPRIRRLGKLAAGRALRGMLQTAHAMADQSYAGGDMHIQLPFRPTLYTKVLSNPTYKEFKDYVRLGELATWPRLPMIRDRTRLSRLFGTCIGQLQARIAARGVTVLRSRPEKS